MQFTFTEANLLPDNHPENVLYQSFTKTFGEEGNVIVIALQDSTFFKKDKREVWKNLNEKIRNRYSKNRFKKFFDLMGIQRHLKAIGIFSRLNYRDGKQNYLKDIPRTLNYNYHVSENYKELNLTLIVVPLF